MLNYIKNNKTLNLIIKPNFSNFSNSINTNFTKNIKNFNKFNNINKINKNYLNFKFNFKLNKNNQKYFHLNHSKLNMVETEKKEKKNLKKPKEDNSSLKEKYSREKLENCMLRRFFVVPAFEIYGGVAGLYDYGPPGCALKSNIEQYWREHFILEDNMLELGCTNLTPHSVLKASGHVDKFTDYMVKDEKNGAFYRADKIIQEFIDKALEKNEKTKKMKEEEVNKYKYIHQNVDKWEETQIDETIAELKVKSPDGNPLSKSTKFNLMFQNQIGPDNGSIGFLRPETAQGQFVNFKRLLEYNGGKLPFASATVGLGFRNEISPRSGLLRVREFSLAEIEHFVDPENKNHKKFNYIKDLTLPLWTSDDQLAGKGVRNDLTMEKAVNDKIIDNQTLAYFLARTYQFLVSVGVSTSGIRFRQHTPAEMAHYASDCWDAEVETSYGWIEVVGHADRTCFDLKNHANFSKKEQFASRILKTPIIHKRIRVETDKAKIAKTHKSEMKLITEAIENMNDEVKEKYCVEFEQSGVTKLVLSNQQVLELPKELMSFKRYEETQTEEKFYPGVIEPAFGIGRIVYCVLEHCFRVRKEDEKRTYFVFPPLVAPYKVSILPLISNDEMNKFIEPLRKSFVANAITYKIDDIAEGIGKRYARTDEVGIPFACTIDEKTLVDGSVTLREINSMKQVRISVS